ncbi:WhiB family transcriptional regulator [Streptomyces sp. NPDC058092]|uniref:WhiB family transcriptional regulator n=1 Tax=Streptomyces sp. NPDC058092 TaxID=3346336 RepID=UPI0036E4A9EC
MSYAPDTLPRAEDWRDRAACADPRYLPIRDFWFADDSDCSQVRTATTICGHCPARDACLAAASEEEAGRGQQSMFGIRGGLTSKQRWNRKKRDAAKRARARKQPDPCGTTATYYQHLMAGEPIDAACQAASDAYEQQLATASQNG